MPNDDARRSNRLLNVLPKEDYKRLHEHLRPHSVQQKQDMGEAGQRIAEVHFPVDAVVSILTRMDEGPSVEIATIGNEGVVGLTVAWGSDAMNPREVATVQAPGDGREHGRRHLPRRAPSAGSTCVFDRAYTLAFFSQVSQQVACNGLHSVEQRCARWLLLTHDRVGTDEFPMTHEFLAQMLGVRRASVTVTAGILQRAGFVEFSAGAGQVVDRAGAGGRGVRVLAASRGRSSTASALRRPLAPERARGCTNVRFRTNPCTLATKVSNGSSALSCAAPIPAPFRCCQLGRSGFPAVLCPFGRRRSWNEPRSPRGRAL